MVLNKNDDADLLVIDIVMDKINYTVIGEFRKKAIKSRHGIFIRFDGKDAEIRRKKAESFNFSRRSHRIFE
jgi:hypothetical protein